MFICGTLDGLLQVSGRRHNTDDLIATVTAVEPPSFVYKGRIAVFSITVLKDERVVIAAEQKPGCADEEVSCVCVSKSVTLLLVVCCTVTMFVLKVRTKFEAFILIHLPK